MSKPVVVVVGAGPGVSGSVAKRYAREGYDAALVGLGADTLATLAEEVRGLGVEAGWAEADVTSPESLRSAIDSLTEAAGRIDVLHFNPSAFRAASVLELTVPDLLADVALGVGALLTAVQAARPRMGSGARITATGSVAADKPDPGAVTLGIQKAGLRTLVHVIDRTLATDGIRAVSVTVDGVLDRDDPTSRFHPDQVADAIFAAAHQDEAGWQTELRHA